MSRVIRVKNTGATDAWEGQVIPNGTYYTLDETEYVRWSQSTKVFNSVSNAVLIVNNGSDIVDDFAIPLQGWNWLIGNLNPPQTSDGDWHIVNENFAHISGNQGINWVIERSLENEEEYSEIFVLPAGRHATVNTLRGGSYRVSSSITLEWFEEITVDQYMRVNPWIRANELAAGVIDGFHASASTVLTLHNTNNEIDKILPNHYYCFDNTAGGGSKFHVQVASIDPGNDQITLVSGLPEDVADGACLALTDRAIGIIGNQIASDTLSWVSPPNMFYGNNKNYFKLTIKNEDKEDVGVVNATLNGWHTPTDGGD